MPSLKAVAKALLILVGLVWTLGGLYALFIIMVAFSTGTAVIHVSVETLVYDKDTKAPVPDCLLGFVGDFAPPYPQARSDPSGRVKETWVGSHTYSGSGLLLLFQRERNPEVDLYLGDSSSDRPVSKIHVALRFHEPLIGDSQTAVHAESPQAQVTAVVRFGNSGGHSAYRFLASLYLDQAQIAACRVEHSKSSS